MRNYFVLTALSLTFIPLNVVQAVVPTGKLDDEGLGVSLSYGFSSISIEQGLIGGKVSTVSITPYPTVWTLDNTASVFSTNSRYSETDLGANLTAHTLYANQGGVFATSSLADGTLLVGGKEGTSATVWSNSSGSWAAATVSEPAIWGWNSSTEVYKTDNLDGDSLQPNLPSVSVTDDAGRTYDMSDTYGCITSISADGNTAIAVMNHDDTDITGSIPLTSGQFPLNKTFIWKKSSSQTFAEVTPTVIDSFNGAPPVTSDGTFLSNGATTGVIDQALPAPGSSASFGVTFDDTIGLDVAYETYTLSSVITHRYTPYGVSLFSLSADGNTAAGDNMVLLERYNNPTGTLWSFNMRQFITTMTLMVSGLM